MAFMQIPKQFNLIPVRDKKPQIPWKEYTERSQTANEKSQFANSEQVGIVTGKVSNILVLDDDGGLDLNKYPIPKTWISKTPRGGTHYYFKWSEEFEQKTTTKVGIMPQVDVRGDGGYVVFYGFEKPYFTVPLAQPPQWLKDLLPNKYEEEVKVLDNTEKSKLEELLNDIKPGNRNDSFTRVAGSLRSRGYSSGDIFLLLESKAREVEFDLKELQILTESVGRYRPKFEIASNGTSIEEFLKDTETVEWIVPSLIAKRSIGFIAGLPETGKTWMLMDLAIECAKGGGLWLNRFPVKQAKVLFIDQERFKGETQRRLKAMIKGKDLDVSAVDSAFFIRCGTTTRLDLQQSYDAFYKEISEIRPDLVIVDSFATFHTKEENSRKDIQEVLERIKQIRTDFGCTFLFIHHENKFAFNKDGEQEPSISHMAARLARPAACETVLTVRKQDAESSMVFHTKSTLSSTVSPFLVKVTDVDEAKTKIKVEAF